MKRITAVIEVTYQPGDPRSVDELRSVTESSTGLAARDNGGFLAAFQVTYAGTDPVREPEAGDFRPPAPAEPGDPQ